ncbi:hydroxyproline-rich glycoprotein family protein [Actinidia rufa]|uniref:Hydroxyproline-rich glycoprotein family protein n=1 Tax=Actinidia rufa TaxID=165716 RepID=A0A7J0F4S6_9ERIC|nr:hydroxyproline-rich glycoprotein family protein [Actinidia rufa]
MKKQCDEKRSLYEYMITRRREKGLRLESSKGESFSSQQLQDALDEYDEEATLFVFRLKSLRTVPKSSDAGSSAPCCSDDGGDNDDSYDDDSDDDDGSYSEHDDGELSFDYGQNDQVKNVVSTPRDSMELDRVDVTFPQVAMVDAAKGNLERNHGGDYFAIGKELKTTSQSAPLSAEKKFDPAERFRQMQPLSARKSNSYVLPTPVEPKSPSFAGPDPVVSGTRQTRLSGVAWSNKPGLSASSPIVSTVPPKLFSGPLLRTPMPPPSSSPKLSTSASPTYVSSPKIRELQELLRPPTNLASKFVGRASNQIGYSGPLLSKGQETIPAANKLATDVASPLPKPHLTISRSFSIPSMGQKGTLSPVLMPLGQPQTSKITEDISTFLRRLRHQFLHQTSSLHPLLLRN